MAKKRRLHGLAGSTQHHLAQAEGHYEEAETEYGKTHQFLEAGRCGKAYTLLRHAISYHEAGIVHEDESGGSIRDSLRKKVSFMSQKVAKAFAKKCLIGGGKLSGMRRRSRR